MAPYYGVKENRYVTNYLLIAYILKAGFAGSADNFEFSAERLFENAKISN